MLVIAVLGIVVAVNIVMEFCEPKIYYEGLIFFKVIYNSDGFSDVFDFSFTNFLLSNAWVSLVSFGDFGREICVHLWTPVQGLLSLWSLSGLLQEALELPLLCSLSALLTYESTCQHYCKYLLWIWLPEFSTLYIFPQFKFLFPLASSTIPGSY